MRRPLPALLAACLAVLVACGGSDGAQPAGATSTTTPTSWLETRIPTPSELQPRPCADVPDPTDYEEGEFPTIIPPCAAPTELAVHTLREGVGDQAEIGNLMIVDYSGMIVGSGEVFDTSYLREIPFDFVLGRGDVVAGWDQGLVGARAGSLLRIDIPRDLAFGDHPPAGQLQPGDALSYNVEVRAIVSSVAADDAPLDLAIPASVGATELTITDLTVGDGEAVEVGDTAIVHLLLVRGDNRVVLFNTWEQDDPLQVVMREGTTLPGLFEGLQGATVGTMRLLVMPPELAYGEAGDTTLGLPAGTDLIVVADVVGVY